MAKTPRIPSLLDYPPYAEAFRVLHALKAGEVKAIERLDALTAKGYDRWHRPNQADVQAAFDAREAAGIAVKEVSTKMYALRNEASAALLRPLRAHYVGILTELRAALEPILELTEREQTFRAAVAENALSMGRAFPVAPADRLGAVARHHLHMLDTLYPEINGDDQ